MKKPAPRRAKEPAPARLYEPVVVRAQLSASQHMALVQIHSILNPLSGRAWTYSEILGACVCLAARHLSLPIPDPCPQLPEEPCPDPIASRDISGTAEVPTTVAPPAPSPNRPRRRRR